MGRNIAIIPARSGSKGLKDKNIKLCAGKPLMAYTIEAAIKSNIFDCVHVSTDSEAYAKIGREYGADIPFLRSASTSSDKASSWDAVQEVLEQYKSRGQVFDMVTLLQPTSPLRDAQDIVAAYQEYKSTGENAVVSVCEVDHSPLWCNTLPENKEMAGFIKNGKEKPRQALQTYYRINGAIYMVSCQFLQEDAHLYRKGCYALVMEKEKSIDIDSGFDFEIAEFLLQSRKNV